jgi:hypothetical protein
VAPVYIALTVRSEYFGHCMEFPGLPEQINDGLYLVPRMTRDQLRSAITGPVAVGGGQIAPRLVLRLLNDVGDTPDHLPVLQHALMRTWDYWSGHHTEGEPLDLRHYEKVGTLRRALSLHADEAYGELDDRGKKIAETMFKALTEPGAEGQGVRHPVSLPHVAVLAGAAEAEVVAVVERFRQPGRSFLTLDAGSMLDLSHESLMRIWDKLRVWVKQEARDGREFRDLANNADRHARHKGNLLQGVDLQVALAWRQRVRPNPVWALRYDPAWLWALSFLDESEAAEKRQWRTRQGLALGLVVFLAAATIFSSVMWQNAERAAEEALEQRFTADQAKKEAVRQKGVAEGAGQDAVEQQMLAELAEDQAVHQKTAAVIAKKEAVDQKTAADAARRQAFLKKAEADQSRLDAWNQKTFAEWAKDDSLQQKATAEWAKLDAEGQKLRAERLKSLAEARELTARSQGLQDPVLAALLAVQAYRMHQANRAGHEDESTEYADATEFYRALYAAWNPPATERLKELNLKAPVRGVAFSGAGRSLVVGTEDGMVQSYLLSGGTQNIVTQFQSGVRSLAPGPSPETFAAGSLGGSLMVWEGPASSQEPIVRLDSSPGVARGPVITLALQRKGPWLAAGRAEGSVELWDWRKGTAAAPQPLPVAGLSVTSLAFSDKGSLAAGGKGGILLWKNLPSPIAVKAIDLSGDGRFLVAGTITGDLLLWDFAVSDDPRPQREEGGLPIRTVRLSGDGKWLAAARGDGTIQLWETERFHQIHHPPLTLAGHKKWVRALDFAGEWLVSGSEDRTVRFWPLRAEQLVKYICGSLGKRDLSEPERRLYLGGGGASPTCPGSPSRAEAHRATP